MPYLKKNSFRPVFVIMTPDYDKTGRYSNPRLANLTFNSNRDFETKLKFSKKLISPQPSYTEEKIIHVARLPHLVSTSYCYRY